jgi:hypothetical protein
MFSQDTEHQRKLRTVSPSGAAIQKYSVSKRVGMPRILRLVKFRSG